MKEQHCGVGEGVNSSFVPKISNNPISDRAMSFFGTRAICDESSAKILVKSRWFLLMSADERIPYILACQRPDDPRSLHSGLEPARTDPLTRFPLCLPHKSCDRNGLAWHSGLVRLALAHPRATVCRDLGSAFGLSRFCRSDCGQKFSLEKHVVSQWWARWPRST